MAKYINLNREEINKRVDELIAQYAGHGIELKLNADNILDKRQLDIWYGGEIAAFEYKNRYSVSIEAIGDVEADLNDENGKVLVKAEDKQDKGCFYSEMCPYIPDDETLDRYIGYDGQNWTKEARLVIWEKNRMEVSIYDNTNKDWVDTGRILGNIESVLDIDYQYVMRYVDCYIERYEADQGNLWRRNRGKP